MIQDTQEIFSGAIAANGTRTGQAITATALSTNVLDFRNGSSPTLVDEGISGPELWLVVVVTAAFNNLTSLTITLESAVDTGISTSPTVHVTKTALLAALTAGATVLRVQLPSDDYQRYVGVRYTVTGTAPTTGAVMAFFTMDINRNVNYPSGFTVDA